MYLIANFAKNYIEEKNSNAANMLHYSCSNLNITASRVIIAYCRNSAAIVSLQSNYFDLENSFLNRMDRKNWHSKSND